MALAIQSIGVDIFHNDSTGTGDARVTFNLVDPTDANPNPTPLTVAVYDAVDMGLSPAQKASIDTMISNVRTAALNKLKSDVAGLS